MKLTNEDKQKVLGAIVDFLSTAAASTRGEVISGALLRFGFSEAELAKVQPPTARVNYIRSYVGTALTNLVAQGDVKLDKSKRYSLAKERLVIVKEAECRTELFRLLKSKSLRKPDLYRALQTKFGTVTTSSKEDDNTLKQMAGEILADGKSKGTILDKDGWLSLPDASKPQKYPSTPMPEDKFLPLFLERIHGMGGPFFENFVANMLEKYYLLRGRSVLTCDVVGGSDDGGVDVILETEDELGFDERVIVQTKNRRSAQVTEKEIREFYGVMNVQKGTRGIYVTTSTFHPGAQKLLQTLPNCVGMDGKKLFSLVKQTLYGIRVVNGGYTFDDAIFLQKML